MEVPVSITAGQSGPEFAPASLTIPTGTSCLWTNRADATQEVVPFKGGPFGPGLTRLTLARRPGTYVFRLRSNPNAQLTITAT